LDIWKNLKQLEVDYDSVVIPRPKHWWFLVVPVEIEFWQVDLIA
jgi:pyridoxamine 5'-phosphate oxidase